MKTKINSPQGFKLNTGGAAVLLALGSLVSVGTAQANTAAGVTLTNSVTVDYNDAGGTAQPQETATVDVTVDHLPSAAWGTVPADQTANSGGTLPGAYSITLTNTGNGSDTYTLTESSVDACTVAGTLTNDAFALTPTPTTLGATVISSVTSTTEFGVPDDSNTADSITRDIEVGDMVLINGDVVEIATVTENSPAGTTTITLASALSAAPSVGDQVGEQISVSLGANGAAGTISGAGATSVCTHTHTLNAAGSTATGGNTETDQDSATFITTVEGVTLAVAKFVRNVTTPAKNTGAAAITYAGEDYFATGAVSGNPSETLEYLVVITNSSGGDASGVEFNDTLPNFTTYVASSNAVDTDGADGGTPGTGEAFEVTAEDEADTTGIVTQSGSTIQVFAGTGGSEATDTGGGITDVGTAPNNKSAIRYQVTID